MRPRTPWSVGLFLAAVVVGCGGDDGRGAAKDSGQGGSPAALRSGAPSSQAGAPSSESSADGRGTLSPEVLERTKEATVFFESTYRPLGRDPASVRDEERLRFNGSGFVVDARGLIMTNEHVVTSLHSVESENGETAAERAAGRRIFVLERVRVRLHSGTERTRVFEGEVVATRPFPLDVALVRIEPDTPLATIPGLDPRSRAAPNALPRETERVWAVGFPLGESMETGLEEFRMTKNRNGPDVSVREGVVTAIRRDARDAVKAIEHSCNIQPGNSGGPLVDSAGRLVGVNSLGGSGSSFAIPLAAVAVALADTLACNGCGDPAAPAPRTLLVDPAAPRDAGAGEGGRLVFGRIEDAMLAARDGDVVRLAPTEFRLAAPLAVRGGVRLAGAGAGRTVLRFQGPEGRPIHEFVVRVEGARYVEVHDLTIANEDGDGLSIAAGASNQVHIHDVEVRAGGAAIGVGGGATPDVVRCMLEGAARFDGARCAPRVERVRAVARQPAFDAKVYVAADASGEAVPVLLGCRLLGEGSGARSTGQAHPVLRGCELANLFAFPPHPRGAVLCDGGDVDVVDCAFWSRGGSGIAMVGEGTAKVTGCVFRGPDAGSCVSVESGRAEVAGCVFRGHGPAVHVFAAGRASVLQCAIFFDEDDRQAEYEWPEPRWPSDSMRATAVFPTATPGEVARQEALDRKSREEHGYGLVAGGGDAVLSYGQNRFETRSQGTAVVLVQGPRADDDGGNQVLGNGAEKRKTDEDTW